MKKLLLLLCFIAFASASDGQALSYNQLQKVFNMWMQGKATNVKAINTQMKAISSRWNIASYQPASTNSEEKYYVWTILDSKKDTTAIALYIEEDETTVKYTLKYAFYDRAVYNSLVQGLKTSPYYKNSITQDTNERTGETSLFGHPDEKLPLSKRVDLILSDYNLKSNSSNSKLYTIDIFSRYIPK